MDRTSTHLLRRDCKALPNDATRSPMTIRTTHPHWTPSGEKLVTMMPATPAMESKNPIVRKMPPKKILNVAANRFISKHLPSICDIIIALRQVAMGGLEPPRQVTADEPQTRCVCQLHHTANVLEGSSWSELLPSFYLLYRLDCITHCLSQLIVVNKFAVLVWLCFLNNNVFKCPSRLLNLLRKCCQQTTKSKTAEGKSKKAQTWAEETILAEASSSTKNHIGKSTLMAYQPFWSRTKCLG
jgi:hypothetical protein